VTRLPPLPATLAAVVLAAPAEARDVGGMDMPEAARVGGAGAPLALNGAGVRSRLFVPVYAAGLYLPARTTDAEAVLAATGPRQLLIKVIHKEIEREKLVSAWNDGFEANHDAAAMARIADRIATFNGLFDSVRAGDVIQIDFPTGGATRVSINGTVRGEVQGADFAAAVLRIWLGASPVSATLKRELLGG
jgi:hypothetical protein